MATRDISLRMALVGSDVPAILAKLKRDIEEIRKNNVDVRLTGLDSIKSATSSISQTSKSVEETKKRFSEMGSKCDDVARQVVSGAKNMETAIQSVGDVTRSIPEALSVVDQTLTSTVSKITGLSTRGAAMGLAVGAAAATAVAGVMTAGVLSAADLESRMIRVNKLIGAEGQVAKDVQKDVQQLMIYSGMSIDQVADVYARAGSSSIGAQAMEAGRLLEAAGDLEGAAKKYAEAREEIKGYATVVLQASSAFEMSTDVAAGSLSAITASYKPLTEGTVSFLTKTASAIDYLGDEVEGTVTESGIMEALAHATRGVGALRPTQDQMADWAALSAAIMSAGQTGDHTGEIISKVFRTLQSDGAKIAPLLGMNIKKYEEELKRDPFAILDKIREKYTKLDTTGKSELAGALGDAYGQQLASLLFADERKWQIYQEARKGAKEAYSSGDRIGESFAKSAAGTQAQWSVLTQTFTVLGQVLGMTVLPAINVLLTTLNAFLGPMAMIIEKFIELAGSIPGADIIALSVGLTIVGGAIVLTAGFASVLAARFGLAALATEIWSASIGVLRGVMTALMTSNPLGWVIIAITLIGAILYKTGALQKAFDWFKNTSFGGGIIDFLSKLMSGEIDFSSLKNAFGGAIGIAMTISPMGWMVKLFSGVTEWLSKIFSATDPLEGVLEYANEWLKSITNFFSWLNSQFSSFIDWLKAGLGITRSEKQSALDEYVGKMGYKWVDLGDVTKDDPFWYIGARYYTSKNQPVSDAMLDKLISERDKAPKGIFEKTFEAIPGLSELCDAINSLREKIEEWLKKIGIGGEPAGTPAEKYRIDESTGKVYQGSTEVYYDKTMGAYTFVPPAAPAAPATPSAIGAHFAGGGLFTGIVHASEEITPLAVSQQGPGPISRALADLYSFYATKPSDTSESPGKIEVNINIDSVSSDVDIKKIGEEAASGLRSEWTKLQRRNSAYLRGGSICR